MDYNGLLNLGAELGCRLMKSGAEIFRVEDSIKRLMQAYGEPDAQVFAIPNCLIVGITPPDGRPITRITRIPAHGTDIELLERCNDLCRQLCRHCPPLPQALQMVTDIDRTHIHYSSRGILAGHFLAAAFFTPFFGGGALDTLAGGLCGLAIGLSSSAMDRLSGSNPFFKTILLATVNSLLAQLLVRFGLGSNVDAITVGALMLLVPGVSLTTAMREVMARDIISGIVHLAESLLTATAIALGVGVALALGQLV